MKQLVIFDLDGTLLNTIEDLGNATNHALRENGYPTHNLSSYPMFVGNGVSKLIERALPEDARSSSNVMRLRNDFMRYYDKHLYDATIPYTGIPELIGELKARGIDMAVASNKYQAAVTRLIGHFFPDTEWVSICGQVEGVPVKPDPSVIFGILAERPTPKSDVLYVGDSGVDMETARRACVLSVGVTWGFRPEKELRETYADHIVSDPDDILDLL